MMFFVLYFYIVKDFNSFFNRWFFKIYIFTYYFLFCKFIIRVIFRIVLCKSIFFINNFFNKFRTYIVLEFPISFAYKNYLNSIETNAVIKKKLPKLKDTDAFKELEQYVSEFTGA